MKVAIHQPNYLPWIGFFDKMDTVDIFVLLDTALYTRSEFINRNKVKTPQGWKWLTVPVRGKGGPINELMIDNSKNWRKNHWTIIREFYKKAPFFDAYSKGFEEIYGQNWDKVADLNISLIYHIKNILGVNTKIVRESDFNAEFGAANTRNVNIVKAVKGTKYISGHGAKVYNDEDLFNQNNIDLIYQDFTHPVYQQRWGDFEPYMSIIDMVFNCGPVTLEIIRKHRNTGQT